MSEHCTGETIDTEPYRVPPLAPGSEPALDLADRATREDSGLGKDQAKAALRPMLRELSGLQERLYAEGKRSLLVVLQAMDAGGKDSTIRKVFGPINPQGCRVTSFKAPSAEELAHDFLWRVHRRTPRHGMIGVFNRSHYEDVLIVRVKGLAPEHVWRPRYRHINNFEALLADEGVHVVKFFLHISKGYQKRRLERRLARPEKHWKFNPDDLAERKRWDGYQKAYAEALARCSTTQAPWYIVPAERRWFRDLVVAKVLLQTLRRMDPKPPEPGFDPSKIVVE